MNLIIYGLENYLRSALIKSLAISLNTRVNNEISITNAQSNKLKLNRLNKFERKGMVITKY